MPGQPHRTTARRESGLSNGDHLKQPQFHSAYLQMPEGYSAELIGGIVFEPSPVGWAHGSHHAHLIYLLKTYCKNTAGVEVGDNATVILSEDDEVQPDAVVRIAPEYGGQSRLTKNGYVQGAPELVAEIAGSSQAIDLHLKKDRYAGAGVLEYIVVCLQPKRLFWFDLRRGKQNLAVVDNIFRSTVLPGLWLHADGLLNLDHSLTDEALDTGLRTPEHAAFMDRMIK